MRPNQETYNHTWIINPLKPLGGKQLGTRGAHGEAGRPQASLTVASQTLPNCQTWARLTVALERKYDPNGIRTFGMMRDLRQSGLTMKSRSWTTAARTSKTPWTSSTPCGYARESCQRQVATEDSSNPMEIIDLWSVMTSSSRERGPGSVPTRRKGEQGQKKKRVSKEHQNWPNNMWARTGCLEQWKPKPQNSSMMFCFYCVKLWNWLGHGWKTKPGSCLASGSRATKN